jgi:hypothetical protein
MPFGYDPAAQSDSGQAAEAAQGLLGMVTNMVADFSCLLIMVSPCVRIHAGIIQNFAWVQLEQDLSYAQPLCLA